MADFVWRGVTFIALYTIDGLFSKSLQGGFGWNTIQQAFVAILFISITQDVDAASSLAYVVLTWLTIWCLHDNGLPDRNVVVRIDN